MKTIKRRLKILLQFIAPNFQELRQRRAFFYRKYKKLYFETQWLYSKFNELCSTYIVDEDNISIFNKKKKIIVIYARHLLGKLKYLESEIGWMGELNRETKKDREQIIKWTKEITSMCGT